LRLSLFTFAFSCGCTATAVRLLCRSVVRAGFFFSESSFELCLFFLTLDHGLCRSRGSLIHVRVLYSSLRAALSATNPKPFRFFFLIEGGCGLGLRGNTLLYVHVCSREVKSLLSLLNVSEDLSLFVCQVPIFLSPFIGIFFFSSPPFLCGGVGVVCCLPFFSGLRGGMALGNGLLGGLSFGFRFCALKPLRLPRRASFSGRSRLGRLLSESSVGPSLFSHRSAHWSPY